MPFPLDALLSDLSSCMKRKAVDLESCLPDKECAMVGPEIASRDSLCGEPG